MSIKYDLAKKRVRQQISTLSMYDFEGEFSKVIAYLQDELKSLEKDYAKSSRKMAEHDYHGGAYADGTKEKTVSFDKFSIEMEQDYEGENQLQIWGERDILSEEMEGLKNKKVVDEATQKEYRRKQFEAMRKEFGE